MQRDLLLCLLHVGAISAAGITLLTIAIVPLAADVDAPAVETVLLLAASNNELLITNVTEALQNLCLVLHFHKRVH